nr:MAG TPA: hypothetical protein [Caudoviricetes sp.]
MTPIPLRRLSIVRITFSITSSQDSIDCASAYFFQHGNISKINGEFPHGGRLARMPTGRARGCALDGWTRSGAVLPPPAAMPYQGASGAAMSRQSRCCHRWPFQGGLGHQNL